MQVSVGFLLPADRPWLALVGAVVADLLTSDDVPWRAIVNQGAASSREVMSSRSVGNEPRSGSALSPLIRASTRSTGPPV
ncbi:hypothetical protein I547_3216 [Mycobacterium kansasii 824]|uniref:Uncharacterized protein n=1 Tax=Mycobacterium kansasii TaxID=1768 RepID=A0A1V3XHR4_MYCKA|nr:hypothetical protein I547_3216 [Mycobacterium kansasii 824]OOK78747.1 hypothetical protein BZL30_3010 [Mycobacterium kansasii]